MIFQFFKDFLENLCRIFPARPVEAPPLCPGPHLDPYPSVLFRPYFVHNGLNLRFRQVQGDIHLLGPETPASDQCTWCRSAAGTCASFYGGTPRGRCCAKARPPSATQTACSHRTGQHLAPPRPSHALFPAKTCPQSPPPTPSPPSQTPAAGASGGSL